jgi:hypothetical protein
LGNPRARETFLTRAASFLSSFPPRNVSPLSMMSWTTIDDVLDVLGHSDPQVVVEIHHCVLASWNDIYAAPSHSTLQRRLPEVVLVGT